MQYRAKVFDSVFVMFTPIDLLDSLEVVVLRYSSLKPQFAQYPAIHTNYSLLITRNSLVRFKYF